MQQQPVLSSTGDDVSPFAMLKQNLRSDNGVIWRARSIDEADSSMDQSSEMMDEHQEESTVATALHSSFDATLLQHNGASVFAESPSVSRTSSWDEGDPSLRGRKHVRQLSEQATELNPPGTVRKKLAIGPDDCLFPPSAATAYSKTPGRPLRPPGCAIKKRGSPTSGSAAKRRRAPFAQRTPFAQRGSPMRRIQATAPSIDVPASATTPMTTVNGDSLLLNSGLRSSDALTPTRGGSILKSNNKWNTCKTAVTAATSILETTLGSTDSVTTSSPTTTRFRFTSFPASLPRVNNPRTRPCPDSVRKRMPFAELSDHNEANQSRDDDAGTQNTSMSSLSADGRPHTRTNEHPPSSILEWKEPEGSDPAVHTRLFLDDDNFGYSDDETADSPVRDIVGRTRLNFNMVLSPPGKDAAEEKYQGGNNLSFLGMNMDLSRPYDQRRITSFQSSLSSNTHLDMDTPVRASRELERPKTPREVRLHFPLDAQCSPIPGIPEEQGECEVDPRMVIDGMMSCAPKNRSDSVTSDSTNAKLRRLRPMPDMAAFESGTSSSRVDRSNDDSATTLDSKGGHISPRLNCPPTPVRTPAWANESLIKHHPFLGARQNSLIATKVLLSCPSQVLEGRSSLESSVLDDDSKSGGLLGGSHANDNADTRFSQLPEYHSGRKANVSGADSSSGQEPTVKTPNSSRLSGPLVSFSNDFDTLASLGSGAFADVFKVRLKRDNRLYAVKRNRRQFRGKRDRDMALAEVQSMQRLQSVCAETSGSGGGRNEKNSYSLYLLFFYRAWQEDGYFLCQTELCCRDTCRELLDSLRFNWNTAKEKYPSLLRNLSAGAKVVPGSYFDTGGRLVPSMTIWKVCHDVAAGLSHIHSHGIVHHDIKPSNIFFVEHARFGAMCKIGDFGMAGDVGSTGDGQEGDAKYMPPELLSSGERHPSSDIFSLGLTLYELATDQQMELPSEGPKWHGLRSDHAPELPKCREPELVEMIKLMTSTSEEKRPTADTILKNDTVISAGHGCDKLLRDYIQDIEGFDKEEEERLAMDHNEDQTPQTGHLRSGVPVRSPSLSMLLPMAPNLLSPAARDMN